MLPIAFVDIELEKNIENILKNSKTTDSKEDKKELYPEHSFLSICTKLGISYEYLEKFTYVDIMKIVYSFLETNIESNKDEKQEQVRMATQADIDKLLM